MKKELSEMSLEELWDLFPIFLVKPNNKWNAYYKEIEAFLKNVLPDQSYRRISHIGSTAIKGIWAKNIVDVLLEIPNSSRLDVITKVIEENGFIKMYTEEKRISFNKGYTKEGFAEKVYHLHLRYEGDNDELYFRDYLNDHPEVAKEYETMKLELWKQYEHNRDAYTQAKTDFIQKWTVEAHKEYGKRY